MSTLAYPQPYKLPAGILTLLVHAAFFGLLYLGIQWQSQPSLGMTVELWESLPDTSEGSSPTVPSPAQAVPATRLEPSKPAKPAVPEKAEIELKGKKVPLKSKERSKPEPRRKMTKAQKQALADQEALEQQQEQIESQQLAERKRAQAEKDAAKGRVMDEYVGKIRAKIKHKIAWSENVAVTAEAVFSVTVLPDGGLMDDPRLERSSGNAAYDDAVKRAILRAQPLPLPVDDEMKSKFRNLKLKFSPKDEE